MKRLILSPLTPDEDDSVEIVERKGIGHPDTICDAIAENLSRTLCREYRQRYGMILHHNVDKALLSGGRAAPSFGGGTVLAPINICLAGRAADLGPKSPSIEEIAVKGTRDWLRDNLHALDVDRHVSLRWLVQPVSRDLQDLFSRAQGNHVPLANDTSIGVGYAPLSPLERLVLALEKRINGRDREREHLAWGEDVKVMGVRNGTAVQLMVACAMIGRYVRHPDDYRAETAAIERLASTLAVEQGMPDCSVSTNAADDLTTGVVYLTVTGTSGENGDDGEVGRGNRVNGLITPCRPMSLEAAAGKNPVTHVGKLYNVVAREIAEQSVADIEEVAAAQCFIASRIGSPLTEPAVLQVKLATRDGAPLGGFARQVEAIARDHLARIPQLIDRFIAGTIQTF
jgi:S-adenosylmethionine synthetase